mmetsp:Transcript_3289/g.9540  ORF Transcript_3289/g.9540 Transcript_3289/m.9540 type:complete len:214 (-) Transcript_3289:264-905(-)
MLERHVSRCRCRKPNARLDLAVQLAGSPAAVPNDALEVLPVKSACTNSLPSFVDTVYVHPLHHLSCTVQLMWAQEEDIFLTHIPAQVEWQSVELRAPLLRVFSGLRPHMNLRRSVQKQSGSAVVVVPVDEDDCLVKVFLAAREHVRVRHKEHALLQIRHLVRPCTPLLSVGLYAIALVSGSSGSHQLSTEVAPIFALHCRRKLVWTGAVAGLI